MNVLILGATGMVGQGVLRECLRDEKVTSVLAIVRQSGGLNHPKLRELLLADFFDVSAVTPHLSGLDACFYCLGVSSFRMKEPEYRRITFDLTLMWARAVLAASPEVTFEYVSGQGTDSSEHGSVMWARVKGETENALLHLGFRAAYMFRPGVIIPLDGIQSKTPAYRVLYSILRPLLPLLNRMFPNQVTDTTRLAKAMIRAATNGALKSVLETTDITRI